MTAIESGTAIGVSYIEQETRAVAIHEAGHAATAHVYRPEIESSRLSIRMRGGSLGHHQAFRRRSASASWQSEARATSSTRSARWRRSTSSTARTRAASAATSVRDRARGDDGRRCGHGARSRIDLPGVKPAAEEEARAKVMKRFEEIGMRLMNRTRGSADFHGDPVASVLRDPYKRRIAAQFLGQAFVTAYALHRREQGRRGEDRERR